MSALFKKIAIIIVCASSGTLLKAQDIALYAEANANTREIGRISASSPELENASAVAPSSSSGSGWYRGTVNGTFSGFVPASNLQSDGRVKKGGVVYTQADSGSAVITFIEDGDRFQLIDRNTEGWARVRFTKAVPVYFRKDPVAGALARAESTPPPPAAATQTTATTGATEDFGYGITAEETIPPAEATTMDTPREEPPPPPAASRTATLPPPVPTDATGPELPRQASPGRPVGQANAEELPRHLEGFLKSNRGVFSRNREYPLRLESPTGDRIAYVNARDLILTRPLEDFLDRPVIVYGKVERVQNRNHLLINARTIRFKQ